MPRKKTLKFTHFHGSYRKVFRQCRFEVLKAANIFIFVIICIITIVEVEGQLNDSLELSQSRMLIEQHIFLIHDKLPAN